MVLVDAPNGMTVDRSTGDVRTAVAVPGVHAVTLTASDSSGR